MPFTKEEVFYEKIQFPTGFWFQSIISFFAYISWNNGFTAIFTKFSGHRKKRCFMRSIKFQMVFYFGPWFRFLHISREIMVLHRFWRNFRVTKGGGILGEELIPKWFLISEHNFVFFAYISWNNGFTAILTNFRVTKRGGILWEVWNSKWFFISGLDFIFCTYLVK